MHAVRSTFQYPSKMRVAYPFNIHWTALISDALNGPTSKFTWKIKYLSIRNCKRDEIYTCFENFSGAVLKAQAVSIPMCRPRDDPRPQIPAGIQDEIRLMDRLLWWWRVIRAPTLRAEINRLER